MDVDNDLDGKLLQQFSSMGTTDRDVLISEFQKLLGNQLNPAGCAFFLDMNNWNLQAAVCSYYDFEQPSARLPSMSFVSDVTIGEGEAVPTDTRFIKTWRLQNSGEDSWPPGCSLKFCSGDNLSNRDRVMVDALKPGELKDVSVDMHSPTTTGVYQSQWRMATPTGLYFGDVIWVIISVDESGLLGVTQQLSTFGSEFIHSSPQAAHNPFASPSKFDSSSSSQFFSPNSSVLAQHGSPHVAELSPSSPGPVCSSRSLFQNSTETQSLDVPSIVSNDTDDAEML
ncbi:hypothetical protein ScPMuIL_015138 [Solemya velum]